MTISRFAEIIDTPMSMILDLLSNNKIPYIIIDDFVRIPDMSIQEVIRIKQIINLYEYLKKGGE